MARKKKLKKVPNLIQLGTCTNHSGKMFGIPSFSTDCTTNERCIARASCPGTICSKCYAQTYLKYRKNLERKTSINSILASMHLWSDKELFFTNYAIYRFEAFGDLINVTHARNYIRLARFNPQTTFTLYTKNYDLFKAGVIAEGGKPDNMILVISSPGINRQLDIADYPLADHVFTVYDKEYIAEHKIIINCGARSCLTCRKCYTKDSPVYINEQLK